jgi:hypothetical protein
MTTSSARLVSSSVGLPGGTVLIVELGVIGDECDRPGVWLSNGKPCIPGPLVEIGWGCCASPRDPIGGGGGCIGAVSTTVSSTPQTGVAISVSGDSSTVLETYFGVRGSEDGGETYGSTPSIGKV